MRDVPEEVLAVLEAGEAETVNLMEWLAADMGKLARAVAAQLPAGRLQTNLLLAADEMGGLGVIARLRAAGRAIALASAPGSSEFDCLRHHKSDLVRQWACYAVNDSALSLSLDHRLNKTLPFAADRNMSVRETAWMAFRPHLAERFEQALPLIERLALNENENIRRFAVEVTRPRSVWGAHLPSLKREPSLALAVLEAVREDPSRYVRLAAGNWLNDASKSRPDWVADLSRRWAKGANPSTHFIVKRGLRTIATKSKQRAGEPVLPLGESRELMENVS